CIDEETITVIHFIGSDDVCSLPASAATSWLHLHTERAETHCGGSISDHHGNMCRVTQFLVGITKKERRK
ncbi:hypothetical protein XENORESO_012061, partial [Xenotaenia resolanae]